MTMTAHSPATTMRDERRHRRRRESGQVLPLLALTILTMGIIALLAITFGQAVVRRQQAQMVVDAAAFAGAAEQAKGLNTIARINEKQFNLLNAIVIAQAKGLLGGYQDNYGTTMARLTCGPACGADWSSSNWFAYESTFNYLNQASKAVNVAYGTLPYVKPPLINKPVRAATKVVNDNFGPGSSIFSGESPVSHGPVLWALDVPSAATLVKLTAPGDYEAADGRHYSPDQGALTTWCTTPCLATVLPPLVAACVETCKNAQRVHYGVINVYYNAIALVSVPTYSAGQFYDNEPGRDIRFTYHLRIAGPKPLVGKSWFGDVPGHGRCREREALWGVSGRQIRGKLGRAASAHTQNSAFRIQPAGWEGDRLHVQSQTHSCPYARETPARDRHGGYQCRHRPIRIRPIHVHRPLSPGRGIASADSRPWSSYLCW